jgi:hypothetical protein
MKKAFLTVLIVCIGRALFGQTSVQADTADINKKISAIQSDLPKLHKIVAINSDDGFRHVYRKDDELRLIRVKAIDKTIEKSVWWYYVSGKMIYAETLWLDNKGQTVFSDKAYLKDDHLIAWFTDGQGMDSASEKFHKMETSLVAYGQKIRDSAEK